MKANKAPEKIYIQCINAKTPYFNDVWESSPVPELENIEYIRKDSFIKKAKKWFEKQNEWHDINGIKHCDMEDFEDFRNYMEGE